MADEEAGQDVGEESMPALLEIDEACNREEPVAELTGVRRLQLAAVSPLRMALVVGLAIVAALGVLCGWLGYRAHQSREAEHFRARLVQVGKQGAVNLTTIDYQHADADVQRILDSASGEFYDDFTARSGPFIDVVKKVQSKSVGTVTEAGLESVNGDEGHVLVAVSVKTTNKGVPDVQPRYWRMRMTVIQQGEDAKVSKVDFVP